MANARLTEAAYQALPGSPLDIDRALYDRIASSSRTLSSSFILPIRSGKAWSIKAGQLCRITTPFGPQVGDLNLWSLHNPREHFGLRGHVNFNERMFRSTIGYGVVYLTFDRCVPSLVILWLDMVKIERVVGCMICWERGAIRMSTVC